MFHHFGLRRYMKEKLPFNNDQNNEQKSKTGSLHSSTSGICDIP